MSYRCADSLRAGSGWNGSNFSNLFLEWNSICFREFLCPSSGVFHRTHDNDICHRRLLTACKQDHNGPAVPSWSCSQVVSKPVWHIPLPCVRWKTHDDGQRNCPKHVEFHSRNKFEKLVHLFGFITRNLTRRTLTWTSVLSWWSWALCLWKCGKSLGQFATPWIILKYMWVTAGIIFDKAKRSFLEEKTLLNTT
jgi:hypothetical protein